MDWYKNPKGIFIHPLIGDILRIEWTEEGKFYFKTAKLNELRKDNSN